MSLSTSIGICQLWGLAYEIVQVEPTIAVNGTLTYYGKATSRNIVDQIQGIYLNPASDVSSG